MGSPTVTLLEAEGVSVRAWAMAWTQAAAPATVVTHGTRAASAASRMR